MRKLLLSGAVLFGLCVTQAEAAHLLQKLPADGTSATYSMEFKEQKEGGQAFSGTISIKSVGQEDVNGEKARWIEVNMKMEQNGRKQDNYVKVLVPEKHIGKGKNMADNVIRGWISDPRGVREYDPKNDNDSNMVSAMFFPNAFQNATELKEAKTVEYQSGKLEAKAGMEGKKTVQEGPIELDLTYRYWTNDKAPFGTFLCEMIMRPMGENLPAEIPAMVVTFTLRDTGKDAKSGLPEKN